MMLNMFRKVSFFFFSGRFLSQHILAFKHCPYTHTQVHTHRFPKDLHPSSSVAMSQHTLNIKKGLLNP